MTGFLTLDRIGRDFGGVRALDEVSLALDEGGIDELDVVGRDGQLRRRAHARVRLENRERGRALRLEHALGDQQSLNASAFSSVSEGWTLPNLLCLAVDIENVLSVIKDSL